MPDIVKELAPVIWEQIQKVDKILLHCHPGPDGDSIGSSLAFFHLLKSLGKSPTIIMGDSEPPKNLSHLPGFDQIVLKNYSQINADDYELFIINDSSNLYQISSKSEVKFPKSLNTIIIDHHASNTGFANINLIDPSYPANCQIIYELFESWGVAISSDIALNLFIGLYTDTGGFKYFPTSSETLLAASKLAKLNPDFSKAIFTLENSNTPQSLKATSLSLSNISTYFSNKVAISAVSFEQLQKNNLIKKDTEKLFISSYLISVIGWEVGISLIEKEPNKIDISLRSRTPEVYNVGKLAVATGFGGGHPVAAGCRLNMSFSQSQEFLIQTIKKTFPSLGKP